MTNSYNPGDVIIKKLNMSSSRGTVNYAPSLMSASVYESIFTPGVLCMMKVLDTDDILGQLKLVGDETLEFSFSVPGGTSASYKLAVTTVKNIEGADSGSLNSKTYEIIASSKEALMAKTNFVQKSYNDQISNIVKDIHKTFLKSDKEIKVEDTKGTQKLIFPNFDPYKAIATARKRAISSQNKSSTFLYFETRENETQIFKFSTIENLLKGSAVKNLKQSDAVGSSTQISTHDNIIAHRIPKQASSLDRIKLGGARKVSDYEFRTRTYKSEIKTTKDTDYKFGGSGSYNSDDFKNKYLNSKNPPQSYIPSDTSQRPVTSIPNNVADQQAYLASLIQNNQHFRVFGDPILTAGVVVKADMVKKVATTGSAEKDELLTGNFLISRIHHEIGSRTDKPRYTCSFEGLHGNLENGV